MEQFVVSARKYRPSTFADVIGQPSLTDTLKKAIVTHKLASAYLFCGPRGVGKTTCARIFAKSINCLHPQEDGEACQECESCVSFNEGRSVNILELNAAANNSVEDIRQIIEQVRIPPQTGNYKVIILDEVHMLSTAASNALLKTLEEPPSYVIFILATTEKQKMLATILSRCQIFDFNRMSIQNIVTDLKMIAEKEGIKYDERALSIIAEKADGGMRDALSIFDQINNFSSGDISYENVLNCLNSLDTEYYFKLTDILLEKKVSDALLLFNEILEKGFDGGVFVGGMASHLRNVLVSHDETTVKLLDASEKVKQQYLAQTRKCTTKFLYKTLALFDRCSNEYKQSYNKRLSVELTLIMAAGAMETDDEISGLSPKTNISPIATQKSTETKTAIVSDSKQSIPANTIPQEEKEHKEAPKAPQKIPSIPRIQITSSVKKADSASPTLAEPLSQNQPAIVNDTVTQEGAQKAWDNYIESLSDKEGALKGRMERMQIEVQKDNSIILHMIGEQVVEFFKPHLPQIQKYMQLKLNNQSLHLVPLANISKREAQSYNPAEYYNLLLQENESLAYLKNELNLVLD